ncbi:hypothetical protein [Maribacter sp. Asnod2-G09]|uniref:hypothetical protein n=1 Tax=Maribacter sp. Asnod2-G09 TaxID=3160577 RepID=UPI00386335F1
MTKFLNLKENHLLMQNVQNQFIKLTLSIFATFLLFSCSKDADLLSEYVISTDDAQLEKSLLINDSFFIEAGQSTIVMDVLNNDNFNADAEIRIIQTSEPFNGIVTINDDNTLTYKVNTESTSETNTSEETTPEETTPEETTPEETTPEETTPEETTPEETTPEETTPEETTQEETTQEEPVTDSFTYTTEETDEAGNVNTQEATVTVNIAQNNIATSGANVYYVTTSGNGGNNGKSESAPWSLAHAFSSAKAGDIIHIKAGNYGSAEFVISNSGINGNPIKFLGYKSIPGDVVATNGSTFNYGENLDATKMPLIKGNSTLTGIGLTIQGKHVQINNIQISDYVHGVISTGDFAVLNNIIINRNGEQNNNTSQTGRGFHIYGDNTILENCFSLNANAEAINLKGANNCIVRNTKVYSDNLPNPGGYYIGITGGGSGNTIDNCLIYRDKNADLHQGHGYVLKDKATNNIIKNSKAINTGIEANFSGVHNNTFENIELIGVYSQDNSEYSTGIRLINGAHDNLFKNIYIEDSNIAIHFRDFNDGFANTDGDRDEAQGGNNNVFENIVSNKSKIIIALTTADTPLGQSTSSGNKFYNCNFSNVTSVPVSSYHKVTGFEFYNCKFENISGYTMAETNGGIGTWNAKYDSCQFINVSFPVPQ